VSAARSDRDRLESKAAALLRRKGYKVRPVGTGGGRWYVWLPGQFSFAPVAMTGNTLIACSLDEQEAQP
jgi:hypothetical protein